ncbi:MAG: transposase, partial [Phycisphaerae bacterium]|nr:transposase [Phycisphaerae bacterium]
PEGITTDGSQLYPGPIADIFGDVRHQACEFHVIAELAKAILKAVAKVRRELKAAMPKLGRGRPSCHAQKKTACRKKRMQQKVTDLFENRYLFVKHHLTPGESKTLRRITRGFPHLRTLRELMNEVYRLFDRRCRTDTALAKLAKLRRRVRRFRKVGKTLQKIFSHNLEKALTFLDDSLLPATSNAVERANRRHNKMQKSVYRVRSHNRIEQRVALDMLRDDPSGGRDQTTVTLHRTRAG